MALSSADPKIDAIIITDGKSSRSLGLEESFKELISRFDQILMRDAFTGKFIGVAIQLDGMLFRLKL
jgi:hypothetical protein